MKAPRRLKEDPEFLAQAGNVLEDEKLVVGNYDLQGLRGRVVGQAPVPAGPSWWKIAAVSGFTASVVTFFLIQLRPAAIAPVAPPTAPPIEILAPAPVGDAPRSTEVGDADLEVPEAPVAAPVPEAPIDDGSADAIEPPEVEPAEPVTPAVPAEPAAVQTPPPAPPAPEAPETRSDLAAELADYNLGVDALDAGRWMDAHAAWSNYLDHWPEGRLRTEARLGMLRALVGADRPGDVERLAGELLATPGLSGQREDLRVVRAEALVQLDRCEDALAVLEGVKRSSRVQAVRSACRKASRSP